MKRLLVILTGFLSKLIGCSRSKLVEGGLYYTQNDDGSYSVLKILKIDQKGVHVRIYSNQYPIPPKKIDENSLYLAGMSRKPNETLGMGHAPILKRVFYRWKATFFQQSTVKEEELEGYSIWLEANGGYFYYGEQ